MDMKDPKFYANLNRKSNNNMKLWTKFKTLIYRGYKLVVKLKPLSS